MQSIILKCSAGGSFDDAKNLIAAQIPQQLLVATTLTCLMVLVQPIDGLSNVLAILTGISIFLGGLFNNLSWSQYGAGHFGRSTAWRGIIPLGSLAVSAMVWFYADLSATTVASAYIVFQIVAIFALRSSVLPRPKVRMARAAVGASYRQSFPYFLSQGLTQVLARIPILATAAYAGAQEAAVVAIALSLTELQSSLPQMRSAITFREAAAANHGRFTRNQLQAAVLALLPGLVAVIVAAYVARAVLPDAYTDLPLLVLLFSIGVSVQAIAASALNVLTVRGHLLLASTVTGIGCLLTWSSYFWLAAVSTYLAVLLGSTFALIVGLVMIYLAFRRQPNEVAQ
ncbi:hypothetical protein [Arthrobacter sp. B0490]|uniref:hypothetical protein n=1 Tax=Arthrobacter sp. B0490 TaxID=2058891 RepID=UPI0011B00FC7|nr:hypothetical protein [Arthrobacter sp. B0490]